MLGRFLLEITLFSSQDGSELNFERVSGRRLVSGSFRTERHFFSIQAGKRDRLENETRQMSEFQFFVHFRSYSKHLFFYIDIVLCLEGAQIVFYILAPPP